MTLGQLTQDLPARDAQNIAHHAGQLEVSILQHLVPAIGDARVVKFEAAAIVYQIAQLTDLARRDEARLQRSVIEQLCQPGVYNWDSQKIGSPSTHSVIGRLLFRLRP
jgi:hypothetical protein